MLLKGEVLERGRLNEMCAVLSGMKLELDEIRSERNELLVKNAVTAEKVLDAVREPRMLGCYTGFSLSDEEALRLIVRHGDMCREGLK
jgi:hypothetical protein